jgi:hypothetical protein
MDTEQWGGMDTETAYHEIFQIYYSNNEGNLVKRIGTCIMTEVDYRSTSHREKWGIFSYWYSSFRS